MTTGLPLITPMRILWRRVSVAARTSLSIVQKRTARRFPPYIPDRAAMLLHKPLLIRPKHRIPCKQRKRDMPPHTELLKLNRRPPHPKPKCPEEISDVPRITQNNAKPRNRIHPPDRIHFKTRKITAEKVRLLPAERTTQHRHPVRCRTGFVPPSKTRPRIIPIQRRPVDQPSSTIPIPWMIPMRDTRRSC